MEKKTAQKINIFLRHLKILVIHKTHPSRIKDMKEKRKKERKKENEKRKNVKGNYGGKKHISDLSYLSKPPQEHLPPPDK
jgi:hypothetical protein